MPCDALTYSFLAKELDSALKGGKIERVIMPEKDEILITVRANRNNLLLSLSAGRYPRVQITSHTKPAPESPFSFCMNLRKNIGGGVIQGVRSLPDERVIFIDILYKNELGAAENKTLIAEVMGKYSNIILAEAAGGRIFECVRHIGLDAGAKRPILPGMKYSLPTQDKLSPLDENGINALSFASGAHEELLKSLKGLSPASITEAVFNAGLAASDSPLNTDEKRQLIDSLKRLYFDELKPCASVTDFFVRPYNSVKGEYIYFDSLCGAMDFFYHQKDVSARIETKSRALLTVLKNALKRAQKRLSEFYLKRESCLNAETDQIKGELITANIYRLKSGQSSAVLENYYDPDLKPIEIELDLSLSPAQNAQKYFKRYQKKKRTLLMTGEQITKAENEIEVFSALIEDLQGCSNDAEIADIADEMARLGMIKKPARRKNSTPSSPLVFDIQGFRVLAGKNNVQNDYITKNAGKNDIWLHVKDYSGSHVIIETQGKQVPDAVILEAAKIAAKNSKAAKSGKAEVDYTLVRHVSKSAGSAAGKVVYVNHKTIVVDG